MPRLPRGGRQPSRTRFVFRVTERRSCVTGIRPLSCYGKTMKSTRQRIKKYRSEGGAADLARVEVLVPPSARKEILAAASRLRAEHRASKELRALYNKALALYRTRIFDSVDLD